MRFFRQWVIDALGFSKSEANGTLVLIVIIFLTAIIPRFFLTEASSRIRQNEADSLILQEWATEYNEQLAVNAAKDNLSPVPLVASVKSRESFHFNPNTVTHQELVRLGFSEKTGKNLVSYRDKGGQFRIKSDIEKIYGISQQRVNELWENIDLPETYPARSPQKKAKSEKEEEKNLIKKSELIDMNGASAEEFREIYGIGDKLSARIVKFRDALGGFHSKDQLKEVYGLSTELVSELSGKFSLSGEVLKMNINTDSAKNLYGHPYVDYNIAYAIVNYREQHGDFQAVEQIRGIKIIDDSLYQKIYPYISLHQ